MELGDEFRLASVRSRLESAEQHPISGKRCLIKVEEEDE
jgi:hypothetical protein